MARKKIGKQRLNESGAEDVAMGVLFILGVIGLFSGLYSHVAFLCVAGVIMIVIGLLLLLYLINYRVWWNDDGVTVQNIFRHSRLYQYKEMSHYYVTVNQTVLVLKDGNKLRFRDSHTDLEELARLQNEMKKHLIGEAESEKHKCLLYWDNCSRPVQLTIFLFLLGLGALFCGAMAWGAGAPQREDHLVYRIVSVAAVEVDEDDEALWLRDEEGTVYEIPFASLAEGADSWIGEDFRLGYEEEGNTVCTMQHRFKNEYVFDLEQYNSTKLRSNIGYVIFFSVFPVLYLAFVTLVLLAYRFPERFWNVYIELETMHYWSRH